jgi:hypothetical protein
MALARAFWYIIAGCVGLMIAIRIVNHIQVRVRYDREIPPRLEGILTLQQVKKVSRRLRQMP